jgi:HPt (histidine-containing phosphotransfer) domain-containing protein
MSESEPILDAVTVRRLLELGGEDLLRRLLSLLLDLAPQHLDALRHALADGDLAAVRRTAHALRSTSGAVGATALLDLCRSLEEAPDLAEARARTAALEGEWAGLQTRLRHWLTGCLEQVGTG